MSWLSKALKKAGRFAKKNAGTLASLALGGAATPVLTAVKSAAAGIKNRRAARIKLQPVSVRAVIAKAASRPIARLGSPSLGEATTMPGGAPLRKASKRRAKASKVVKAPKASTKRSKGRSAPTGGKDFKALSASWKAAGKPGKWIDWVKSH